MSIDGKKLGSAIFDAVEAAAMTVIESGKERIELEDLSYEIATRSLVSISERRRRPAGA